jgi:hypothetical protein
MLMPLLRRLNGFAAGIDPFISTASSWVSR